MMLSDLVIAVDFIRQNPIRPIRRRTSISLQVGVNPGDDILRNYSAMEGWYLQYPASMTMQ